MRAWNAFVLDAHVHERLLDAPAGMAFDLYPLTRTAVQLHCHLAHPPRSPRRRSYDTSMRAVFEIRPPAWGETLAILQSVSLPDSQRPVRARVVDVEGERVTIDFPALDGETTAEQLLAACVAGEWADRGDVESCRLVEVEWPDRLPGPAFPAPPGVSVGAIVKPALGLAPAEAATVAAELASGGAVLAKDDELQRSSPERVRAVNAALPEQVLYAANVTGVDADAIVG